MHEDVGKSRIIFALGFYPQKLTYMFNLFINIWTLEVYCVETEWKEKELEWSQDRQAILFQ